MIILNDKNRNMTWKTLNSDVVLVIKTLEFKISFGFLISDFRLVRVKMREDGS